MNSSRIKTTVQWARQAAAALVTASLLVGGPTMASGSSSSSRVPDIVKPERKHGTIVDVAVSNPAFSTLVSLLTSAGLVGTLQGPGPFMVFVPTSDAFAKVPDALIGLLASDTAALQTVLLYHVTAGTQDPRFALLSRDIKTVQGQEVFAERDTLFINDSRVLGRRFIPTRRFPAVQVAGNRCVRPARELRLR